MLSEKWKLRRKLRTKKAYIEGQLACPSTIDDDDGRLFDLLITSNESTKDEDE
jgi:hypothetical protein